MSGGIEEPYSIAALPKPLDAEHGRVLGANVYSINGSRKRKRHEVAIGVDGESVNIYNTQNQTTATSYALPPQSSLAAPPCSIYCKRAKPLQPQRQTYIAVRDGSNGQKARLVSISEDLGKPQSEEREPRAPSRRERKLREGNISAIDIIGPGPNEGDQSNDRSVLVSYTNGNVDCMSGDLSATRWEHTANVADRDGEFEFSAVVDFETARKGLLRSREDVLAILDTTLQGSKGGNALPLLVQVVRSDSRRLLCIYAIRNAYGQSLQSQRSPLEEVLSYDLPFRPRYGSEVAYYELHAASGMLYQRLGGRLNVVDLSGTTPRLAFELGRKGNPVVTSFTRLSNATVLVVSSGKMAVYDTKYGSVLSSLESPSNQSYLPSSIIAQFSDLSIVVGLSGNNLVACQVGDMLDDGKRAKTHGPLLLEVMGKGKAAHDILGVSQKQEKKRKKWEQWTSRIDHFVNHSDAEGLEDLVAKELDIINVMESHPATNGDVNGHANGHSLSENSEWDLPAHTFDAQNVNRAKATYLLGKIFRWRSDSIRTHEREYHLEIYLLSRNILRWLATAGYLTVTEVQLVLSGALQGTEHRPQVVPGDVMAAIGEADSSLKLMCDLVGLPVYWPVDDVVKGLQILIRILDIQEDDDANDDPKALTNGDVVMEGGDVDFELAAAVKEMDEAQRILESGAAIRSEVCRLLLARLESLPQKDVALTMNRMMTSEDIIFFINILRQELLNGGWTRRYFEQYDNEQEENFSGLGKVQDIVPSNQAIRTITKLLSCAIDAIGLSGWLVGRSAELDETYALVQNLQNEMSAALLGLFEAQKLDVVLMDMGRAAGAAQQQSQSNLKRKRHIGEEEELLSPEQTFMPLGGRGEPPVVHDWTSKTGRKTKAAIAEQKNRNVGKYSFERIRI